MGIFLLVSLFVLSWAEIGAEQYECSASRCKHHGPVIRFPFRLKGHQPEHCGYPGFDLYCDDKRQTVLELPTSVGLVIRNINYTSQEILVSVQQGCFLTKLQHLNLSATPFPFDQWGFSNYTLFNCSSTIPELEDYYSAEIACLSGLGYHVYALESTSSLSNYPTLLYCTRNYSNPISLPRDIFGCSSYMRYADLPCDIFSQIQRYFRLPWVNPLCGNCEEHGGKCRFKSNNNNTTKPEIECFYVPKPTKGTVLQSILFKIAGAMSGVVLLVLLLIVVYRVRSSDKLEKLNRVKIEMFLKDYKELKPTRYSYSDIKRITNQFKEKLGQGAYGTVFKGSLSNEILVAVKMLNNSQGNGDDFINEMGTMGRIHHVNVVRLVGFCADGTKRALVYDFLPNESLDKFIFSADDGNRRFALGWEKLQDIAIGIAKGIEYLHQGCDQRILHFDIKPHNILLDNNFNPKISDFGLAKLCSKDQSAVSMTAARGTMGYIAPEVLSRNFGNASHKSDVYSFGMLLLEMVGGRKNIDVTVDNTSQVYFPEWVYGHLSQGREVELRIEEDGDAHIAKKLTQVGLWCIQWYPLDRPSMKVALQMLEGQGNNLPNPPNPFSSAADQTRSV